MWASAGGADESFWSKSSLIFCECARGGTMLLLFQGAVSSVLYKNTKFSAHTMFVDRVEVNASSAEAQKWSDICSASV